MDLQKINVKFFVASSGGIRLTDLIDIFNSWIQGSDGDYYDVADYSHMHAGPGILLISHEANISMDDTGNRLGLLYNRKQPLAGSNREKLQFVFKSALEFCQRIENEPALQGRLKFQANEIMFLINDRLLAPDTEETLRAVQPDLERLAEALYAGARFTLTHRKDARERFAVEIKTPAHFEISELLKNLRQRKRPEEEGSWVTTRSLSR